MLGYRVREVIGSIYFYVIRLGGLATAIVAICAGINYLPESAKKEIIHQLHQPKRYFDERFKTNDFYLQGASDVDRSDPDKAIQITTDLIDRNPPNTLAFAYVIRGTAYFNRHIYDKASSDFSRAAAISPNMNDVQVVKDIADGLGFVTKGNFIEAVAPLSDAVKQVKAAPGISIILNETSIDLAQLVYLSRGEVYAAIKENDLAIKDFQEAIAIDKSSWASFSDLAVAYLKKDERRYDDQMLDAINTAIHLNPASWLLYFNRGAIFVKLKRFDEAIVDTATVTKMQPNYDLPHFRLGFLYAIDENPKKDISLAEGEFISVLNSIPIPPEFLPGTPIPHDDLKLSALFALGAIRLQALGLRMGNPTQMTAATIQTFSDIIEDHPDEGKAYACRALTKKIAKFPTSEVLKDVAKAKSLGADDRDCRTIQ